MKQTILLIVSSMVVNYGFSQTYTEELNTPFFGVKEGHLEFADVDGDSDPDLLITGSGLTHLYFNDGVGNYTLGDSTTFPLVFEGAFDFGDVDNDGDQDVLISGNEGQNTSRLFLNDGSGSFSEDTTQSFAGQWRGEVLFNDIDNDNDLDVLITGSIYSFTYPSFSHIYTNDGAGNFTLFQDTLTGVRNGDAVFADINGDNFSDLVMCGFTGSDITTVVYVNDGNGVMVEDTTSTIQDVYYGSIDASDVDGDGDQDILIAGAKDGMNTKYTGLYLNDGNGAFTLVASGLPDVHTGVVEFADIDNDGDEDVCLAGWASTRSTSLYLNNGSGYFSELSGASFAPTSGGEIDFADIDGDADIDLIYGGMGNSNQGETHLYTRDGSSLGFAGNQESVDYTIYPNPTTGLIHIDGSQQIDKITVTDELGRKVFSKSGQVDLLDLTFLENGCYFLEFSTGDEAWTKRIVKQ